MSSQLPRADDLRVIINQRGFRVKALAVHAGLDVRTLDRRFAGQFRTRPKKWIIRERMNCAPPLLAEGLSNKEAAALLGCTCESNFCRDFNRYFGRAPQEFAGIQEGGPLVSCFDKALPRIVNRAELRRQKHVENPTKMLMKAPLDSRPLQTKES